MLNFNSCGFLLPDRNTSSTISELEQTFKINNVREDIYENYLNYSKNLKEVIGKEIKQWVDGSFVTKKPKPKSSGFLYSFLYFLYSFLFFLSSITQSIPPSSLDHSQTSYLA
jgi:hypothetical protein